METIKGIYDGKNFLPIEPVPVEGNYEVTITFTKPMMTKEKKKEILIRHFGKWDDEDVKVILEIIEERKNFSRGQDINEKLDHQETISSVMGICNKYANPDLIHLEKEAWGEAMREKHGIN